MESEVQCGYSICSHTSRHLLALKNSGWSSTGSNGTRLTVILVRTVAGVDTGEAVTLHNTGKTLTFAGSNNVQLRANLEDVNADGLANGAGGSVSCADSG